MKFFKIIIFFLILVLGANFAPNIGIFNFLRTEIHKEMREVIARNNFRKKDIVVFEEHQLKNIRWEKKNEFVLNGYYYDIIKRETKGNKKLIYCLKDKKEIVLNKVQKIASAFLLQKVKKTFIDNPSTKISLPVSFTAVIPVFSYQIISQKKFKRINIYFPSFKVSYFSKIKIPPPETFLV